MQSKLDQIFKELDTNMVKETISYHGNDSNVVIQTLHNFELSDEISNATESAFRLLDTIDGFQGCKLFFELDTSDTQIEFFTNSNGKSDHRLLPAIKIKISYPESLFLLCKQQFTNPPKLLPTLTGRLVCEGGMYRFYRK